MNHYFYEGPVVGFNNVITEKWKGDTYAVSKKKAISNLRYQFKKQHGLVNNTRISLLSVIKED